MGIDGGMKRLVWLSAALVFLCVIKQARAVEPGSFAYVLQAESFGHGKADAVARLARCERDWVVLDAVYSGDAAWTPDDIETVRNGRNARKVIAYISIGEAEEYRAYWRKEWGGIGRITASAPSWLGAENPDWRGNYRVKYWRPEWQRLILGSVEEAMGRGFDGVYLDIVDGFETFEREGDEFIDDRLNPETRQSFRRDMVDWVKLIAARARAVKPDALVIPQNGSQLLSQADFVATINAIGIEDLFTNGNKAQPASHSDFVLGSLKKMTSAGKPVLVIEYPRHAPQQSLARTKAGANGMVWLVTDRSLKTLGSSGR